MGFKLVPYLRGLGMACEDSCSRRGQKQREPQLKKKKGIALPAQCSLLLGETQYLKQTELKEADHWLPLSLDTTAPPSLPLVCADKLFVVFVRATL